MKCHLYEFRKKKVIIPCDSLYPHVPKCPGNYCFSFSIRSNYICLAPSACFPKLCSQTKPKKLHIHVAFPWRTCPVLVPLVPMFPARLGQLFSRQAATCIAFSVSCLQMYCMLLFGDKSVWVRLLSGGITRCSLCRLSAGFGLGSSTLSAVQLHSKQLGPAFRSTSTSACGDLDELDERQLLNMHALTKKKKNLEREAIKANEAQMQDEL